MRSIYGGSRAYGRKLMALLLLLRLRSGFISRSSGGWGEGGGQLFLSGHWMLGHVFSLLDALLLLFGGLENPLAPCFSKSMLLLGLYSYYSYFTQLLLRSAFRHIAPRAAAERPKNSRLASLKARLFMR